MSASFGSAGVWTIVLAGGSGMRFGAPKQFLDLAGKTLIQHSIDAARTVSAGVVVVLPDPAAAPKTVHDSADAVVAGGAVRAASVRAGLAAVPPAAEVIVIADAAHPLASADLFAAVVQAVKTGADGAFPALPITEAIAELNTDSTRGAAVSKVDRVLIQMPQAFNATVFRYAQDLAHQQGRDGVEDSELIATTNVEGRATRVVAVPGDPANLHVTTPAELDLARLWAAGPSRPA